MNIPIVPGSLVEMTGVRWPTLLYVLSFDEYRGTHSCMVIDHKYVFSGCVGNWDLNTKWWKVV